jgi:hypothetical protein
MKNTASKAQDVLVMLQCYHSILNTAWPRPDYPSLAGAGRFIHTKLFTALENADMKLISLFQEAEKEGLSVEYGELWEYCHQILFALKRLETNCLHPSIDPAFNLLYLTSGVLYEGIAVTMPSRPEPDKRFASVEDLPSLASACKLKIGTGSARAKNLSDNLATTVSELTALAQKCNQSKM